MNKPERECDVRSILTGNKAIFSSKMTFGFDFIFKSIHSQEYHWTEIVKNSYWFLELQSHKTQLALQIADTVQRIDTMESEIVSQVSKGLEDLKARYDIESADHLPPKMQQRELDGWKNRHIGKKWDTAYKLWKEMNALKAQLPDLHNAHDTCDNLELFMGGYASYLEHMGFLQNLPANFQEMGPANLTTKGILATEVNEGNVLLMPELYLHCVNNMPDSPTEFLAALSMFMTGDKIPSVSPDTINEHDTTTCDLMSVVKQRSAEMLAEMDTFGIQVPDEQWEINESWFPIMMDWFDGKCVSYITSKYGIYEGNLTRAMMKLVNLLNEWRNMATYCGHVHMLTYVQDLETHIFRDIISPDSLYIHV